MAGHSQYANIKHRKDAQDNKRGKIFQKLSRKIYVAVKLSGEKIESNPRLKLLLEKARRINIPKDSINRAINKATNKNETTHYDAITYEGFGPNNVAIIVHCSTDNKNRTASNIRSYFNKAGSQLNAVQYLFQTAGVIELNSMLTTDEVLEMVINFDIFNIEKNDDIILVTLKPQQLAVAISVLETNGINEFIANNIRNIPNDFVTINDKQQEKGLMNLLDNIEDDYDVLNIEHNFQK